MKHYTTLIFSLLFLVAPLGITSAQSKVAHINTQQLISEKDKEYGQAES